LSFIRGALIPPTAQGRPLSPVPADHVVTDEVAAYRLADAPFPVISASFIKATHPPKTRPKPKYKQTPRKSERTRRLAILQKSFERMR